MGRAGRDRGHARIGQSVALCSARKHCQAYAADENDNSNKKRRNVFRDFFFFFFTLTKSSTEQDEQLDLLGESINRTKQIALAIDDEVTDQDKLLQGLSSHVDHVSSARSSHPSSSCSHPFVSSRLVPNYAILLVVLSAPPNLQAPSVCGPSFVSCFWVLLQRLYWVSARYNRSCSNRDLLPRSQLLNFECEKIEIVCLPKDLV